MRRCIVCGNMGDDNSTVCEKCGNPYVDVAESVSNEEKQEEAPQVQDALQSGDKEPAAAQGEKTAQPAAQNRPPRRVRSGPQIYGQAGSAQGAQDPYAQQGMVRRNVQGRPAGAAQRVPNRPAQAQRAAQGSGAGRPAGQVQGNPAGRPMGPAQGSPAGRPMSPAQGGPAGRPMGPVQGGPAGRPAGQMQGYYSRQMAERARAALKSPVFVLVALFNTIYFVSSIAAIFMNQLNYSQVVRLLRTVSLPSQVSGYVNTLLVLLASLDSGHVVVNIVLNIPNLLLCIGLWLILVTAMKARENMSGVGFGFAKAYVIINMIKACVVMVICLVLGVAIVIAAWAAGTQSMIIASVIALVVVIIVVMMIIMYYFSYLATLKTCRMNADEGESYGRVSGYVAVIHIILALVSIINLLSGIVNSEITGIVGSVGKIGWMFLFGVWIFMYRGKMSEFED